jgi:spore maturation protein CgeD
MSQWDEPGVAPAIDAYWADAPIEDAHRTWLASIVRDAIRRGTVLDVGCGSGRVLDKIGGLPAVYSYTGVDASEAMLAIARRRHPSATWTHGDLLHLAPESADTVLCLDVLGHVRGALVDELRVLILAARDTAIISLWIGDRAHDDTETVSTATFPHCVRTHDAFVRAVYEAVPDCAVVEHHQSGSNSCYVIRRRLRHTIIVGSYNRAKYVAHAIRSVMTQSCPNWQLIVTDDGSDTDTITSIRDAFNDDPRCSLLRAVPLPPGPRPNGNVRAVERINDAIPLITGDIVHYLPDDDWFLPGRFEAFEAAFKDPRVIMAHGVLLFSDGDSGLIAADRRIAFDIPISEPNCVLDQTQVAHRALVFRTIPRWPTENIDYCADGVFYETLCTAGYGPIYPVAHDVSVHRRHRFNLEYWHENATDKRE